MINCGSISTFSICQPLNKMHANQTYFTEYSIEKYSKNLSNVIHSTGRFILKTLSVSAQPKGIAFNWVNTQLYCRGLTTIFIDVVASHVYPKHVRFAICVLMPRTQFTSRISSKFTHNIRPTTVCCIDECHISVSFKLDWVWWNVINLLAQKKNICIFSEIRLFNVRMTYHQELGYSKPE